MLRDRLTGALIGLARATDGNEHLISDASTRVIVESLAALGSGDDAALEKLLARVTEEKRNMVPDCFTCASPCGKNSDYDMRALWKAPEEVRGLKKGILRSIRDIAALGCRDAETERFFYKALIVLGMDGWSGEELQPIAAEAESRRAGDDCVM